jgi:large subunit ribosomal protein L10
MKREDKVQLVEQWSADFKETPHAVLVDYRGLTVEQATNLRAKIREAGSSYKVLKNTLGRRAVADSPLELLKEHMVGPTAMATAKEDPVAMAKALMDFAEDNPKLEIKIGVLNGEIIDSDQIKALSKMPSREELLAKLLFLLKAPVQGLATSLSAITRDLAVVLNQVAQQKEN